MKLKQLSLFAGMMSGSILVLGTAFWITFAASYLEPSISTGSLFAFLVIALLFLGAADLPKGSLLVATSQVGARMMFKNAVELVQSLTDDHEKPLYNLDSAVCSQSYLRGQSVLSTGAATYNIPMLKSQQETARVNQRLLALQDIFVTFSLGVGISIGAATASAAVPYTYGNQIAFSTSGAAAALWTIYNGFIQLVNNQRQVVPAFDMLRFYKAPAIQAITDIYYDGTAVQQDQKDLFEDIFTPIEPGWVINGAGNMQMSVICGSAPAAIQADSAIDMVQRGILLQNVTPVN